MDNPIQITGISKLIPSYNDVDLSKIEETIINGAQNNTDDDIDASDVYKQEMDRLASDFLYLPTDRNSNNRDLINEDTADNEQNIDSIADEIPEWQPSDNRLNNMTVEAQKQIQINKVLHDIGTDQELELDIHREHDEDKKASLLEQIDMLRETLEDEGIKISDVPLVNKNSSINDIQDVYHVLRYKNDRNRYCCFAEEGILGLAGVVEYLFDGEKEWLGRKPDMVGWSSTVKVKLRRMRYDTSTIVQDIMHKYQPSPIWRTILEFAPSILFYSRRKSETKKDMLLNKDGEIAFQQQTSKLRSI